MLNFVLCDDNKNILDKLSQMLENIFLQNDYNAKITYTCDNAADLFDYLNENNIDVLFLDINLKNKLTGLDIAEQIRKKNKNIYIIFITGHLEYALVAYKYKTFDYIPKPFVSERLELTISRLFEDIKSSVSNFIKVGNSQMLIRENDVLYIKKDNMKNCIYLSNNDVCPIGPKYKNNLLEVINNYEYNTKDNECFNESERRAN